MAAGVALLALALLMALQPTNWRPGVRGQSTTEYAIFVAVVAAALVAMTVYVRRAIQAHLKLMERQTNDQPMQQ